MDKAHRMGATDVAYRSIRARIMSGELKDGERLIEQTLASDMGLSRTPVREAIKRLILEGFVERGDGYSTRVADSSHEEIDQIFEIRRRLECYAVERACQFATEEEIDRLGRLAKNMAELTPPFGPGDYERLAAMNADYHRTVADAARSPRLKAILAMAVDVGIVARTYKTYSDHDLVRSTQHHIELVDALRARSASWASSVMSSHIMAAASAIAKTEKPKRGRP